MRAVIRVASCSRRRACAYAAALRDRRAALGRQLAERQRSVPSAQLGDLAQRAGSALEPARGDQPRGRRAAARPRRGWRAPGSRGRRSRAGSPVSASPPRPPAPPGRARPVAARRGEQVARSSRPLGRRDRVPAAVEDTPSSTPSASATGDERRAGMRCGADLEVRRRAAPSEPAPSRAPRRYARAAARRGRRRRAGGALERPAARRGRRPRAAPARRVSPCDVELVARRAANARRRYVRISLIDVEAAQQAERTARDCGAADVQVQRDGAAAAQVSVPAPWKRPRARRAGARSRGSMAASSLRSSSDEDTVAVRKAWRDDD